MPVSWVQSINPVMIIVLAGAFATLWTKLAPRMFHTQMVALFFLSIGLGTAMSGKLAEYYNPTDETGFFTWIGLAAVLTGIAMLALTRPISRMMKGVR